MIFVTGGISSGKREFVLENFGYVESDLSLELDSGCKVLYNLEKINCSDLDSVLEKLQSFEVVVCAELGCGLVPIDKGEREHREQVGRLCIEIARKSSEVYRVFSGIGSRIK